MDFWRDSYCQKILLQLLPRSTIPFPWTWGLCMTILTTSCKFHLAWNSLPFDFTFIPFLARPSWEIMLISMLVLCNAHPSTTRAGSSGETQNSVELTIYNLYCDFMKPMLLHTWWLRFPILPCQCNCWAGLAQLHFYEFYCVKLLKYTPLNFIQKMFIRKTKDTKTQNHK